MNPGVPADDGCEDWAAAAGGAVASVEDCWAPWEAAVAVGAACCCCARGESGGLGARAESKNHDN